MVYWRQVDAWHHIRQHPVRGRGRRSGAGRLRVQQREQRCLSAAAAQTGGDDIEFDGIDHQSAAGQTAVAHRVTQPAQRGQVAPGDRRRHARRESGHGERADRDAARQEAESRLDLVASGVVDRPKSSHRGPGRRRRSELAEWLRRLQRQTTAVNWLDSDVSQCGVHQQRSHVSARRNTTALQIWGICWPNNRARFGLDLSVAGWQLSDIAFLFQFMPFQC